MRTFLMLLAVNIGCAVAIPLLARLCWYVVSGEMSLP